MKPIIVIVLLLAALYFATNLYKGSTLKDDGNITHFNKSLKGATQYLSKESKINFICPDDDAQKILEARYVLFPIELDFEKDKNHDTALIINPVNDSNHVLNHTVIWKNRDDKFWYYLITKKQNP